jgi:hypothetical protein
LVIIFKASDCPFCILLLLLLLFRMHVILIIIPF